MNSERENAMDTLKVRITEQKSLLDLASERISNIALSPDCAEQVQNISNTLTASIQAEVDYEWIMALLEIGEFSPQNLLEVWDKKDELSRRAQQDREKS